MAAAKTITQKASTQAAPVAGLVQVPVDTVDLVAAVAQLQQSFDELVTRFHAHTHSANATPIIVGQQVTGAPVASPNVFVPAAS